MSGNKRTEAWGRTRKAADQMAAQMKPLAKSSGQAARRQLFRTRAWAAPRVERTGKVLEDTVAPKVSSMLSSAAERLDPARPKRGRWRLPVGIATAVTAAASAAAAVLRNRSKNATDDTATDTGTADAAATEAMTPDMNGTGDISDTVEAKAEPQSEDKQAH